jgi:hypothetical protein
MSPFWRVKQPRITLIFLTTDYTDYCSHGLPSRPSALMFRLGSHRPGVLIVPMSFGIGSTSFHGFFMFKSV